MKRLALTIALAACSEPAPSAGIRAREAFVRDLAVREGLVAAWQLGNRSDLRFEDDLSAIQCVAPDGSVVDRDRGQRCKSGEAAPARWMGATARLRVRGTGAMRLWLHGRVDRTRVLTEPDLTVTFAGAVAYAGALAPDGSFEVTLDVQPSGAWQDVYVILSSVGEPMREPSRMAAARLDGVRWEPAR